MQHNTCRLCGSRLRRSGDTMLCPHCGAQRPARGLLRAAIAILALGWAGTAQADVIFEADIITASAPMCAEGDPLCDSDFVCREDETGRTCETLAGWVERQRVARANTVGPKGWR
jgi:hypothetical protein